MAPVQDGVELIVGTVWDARFVPIVLVGLRGVRAEIFGDVAVALAPVEADGARRLVLSLRGAAQLTGRAGGLGSTSQLRPRRPRRRRGSARRIVTSTNWRSIRSWSLEPARWPSTPIPRDARRRRAHEMTTRRYQPCRT
jgi:ATP-grasp domain-containing protein